MEAELNHTHDAARQSWLPAASAAGTAFPLQNLPYAVFRRKDSTEPFRGGVAIGDQIVDLAALREAGCLHGLAADAATAAAGQTLNAFFEMGPPAWRALRHALFGLLERGSPHEAMVRPCLLPQALAEYAVPTRIGDYTDFYTSLDHAVNCSKPLGLAVTPNFDWLPIAYHGRASSIGVSGQAVRRPVGQYRVEGVAHPVVGPCQRLDYELELGIFIGTGNAQGTPIDIAQAQRHVFGICLLNDWSARDIQGWEMQPLGPFQSKNFATTISPWIVTLEALLPYRQPWRRAAGRPLPLPYLDAPGNDAAGAFDIRLEVAVQSANRAARGLPAATLTRTSFRHQYWSIAQMIAHHTVGGCNLQAGDLLGSGTISGPTPGEAGALIELTVAGTQPVDIGAGEMRGFLEDGDSVIFSGWCERAGYARIGFGTNHGKILPARHVGA